MQVLLGIIRNMNGTISVAVSEIYIQSFNSSLSRYSDRSSKFYLLREKAEQGERRPRANCFMSLQTRKLGRITLVGGDTLVLGDISSEEWFPLSSETADIVIFDYNMRLKGFYLVIITVCGVIKDKQPLNSYRASPTFCYPLKKFISRNMKKL